MVNDQNQGHINEEVLCNVSNEKKIEKSLHLRRTRRNSPSKQARQIADNTRHGAYMDNSIKKMVTLKPQHTILFHVKQIANEEATHGK